MKSITMKITRYLKNLLSGKDMIADTLTALNENKADKKEVQKMFAELEKAIAKAPKSQVTIETIKTLIEASKGTKNAISIENFTGFNTDVDSKDFYTGEKGKPPVPMQIHPSIKKRIADLEKSIQELKTKVS